MGCTVWADYNYYNFWYYWNPQMVKLFLLAPVVHIAQCAGAYHIGCHDHHGGRSHKNAGGSIGFASFWALLNSIIFACINGGPSFWCIWCMDFLVWTLLFAGALGAIAKGFSHGPWHQEFPGGAKCLGKLGALFLFLGQLL